MQRHDNSFCFTMTIACKLSLQIGPRIRSFEACISLFTDAEVGYLCFCLAVKKYNQCSVLCYFIYLFLNVIGTIDEKV